jgi:hypothetical protein
MGRDRYQSLDGVAKARERERGRERLAREKARREEAKRGPKPTINPGSGSWREEYEPWDEA